ncbi:type III-B CRISPR module-associated Cmr3 family protein [Clostridium ihumii]|uniref:type III-B CRISPR module-associated Cmr3 family protein n=1 Tax=Clostridium ihumii TaxID=1470356 RepID=UPI003D328E81
MTFRLIEIKPCDNTFFRDGNQFNKEISKIIRSKNTAYPSVFFGAIFTAILSENDDFRKIFFENNMYDHEKILEIGQVYLFNRKNRECYIKAPMDLFMDERNNITLGNFKKNNKYNSLKYKYILESPVNTKFNRLENMYININDIYDGYFKKQEFALELVDENQIFIKNYKVGIGINKENKTTEEGAFYQVEYTEFNNNEWSYIVEYNINYDYLNNNYKDVEIKKLDSGYLKLGGENKACQYKHLKNTYIEKFRNQEQLSGNLYKIIFTSETYFNENINDYLEKNNIIILGMSNGKPLYIGGYDMKGKKGNPRVMYKGFSAGTVILVEIKKDYNIQDIKEIIKCGNTKGFNNCIVLREEF